MDIKKIKDSILCDRNYWVDQEDIFTEVLFPLLLVVTDIRLSSFTMSLSCQVQYEQQEKDICGNLIWWHQLFHYFKQEQSTTCAGTISHHKKKKKINRSTGRTVYPLTWLINTIHHSLKSTKTLMGFKAGRDNRNHLQLLSSLHSLQTPAWCHDELLGSGGTTVKKCTQPWISDLKHGKSIIVLNQLCQLLIVLSVQTMRLIYALISHQFSFQPLTALLKPYLKDEKRPITRKLPMFIRHFQLF